MAVQTGLARLADDPAVLAGRRVGLICNPTSVDAELRHAIDILRDKVNLVALFGPEHGVRGDAQDMIGVDSDAVSGVPVHSLYGHTAESLLGAEWTKPYAREKAAFPLPYVRAAKFWPPVGRLNNVLGDRKLFCTCPPISDYS